MIAVRFDEEGATLVERVSGDNIGRQLALVLDGRLIMAPEIRSRFSEDVVINGVFTLQELQLLLPALNNPIDVPHRIIERSLF